MSARTQLLRLERSGRKGACCWFRGAVGLKGRGLHPHTICSGVRGGTLRAAYQVAGLLTLCIVCHVSVPTVTCRKGHSASVWAVRLRCVFRHVLNVMARGQGDWAGGAASVGWHLVSWRAGFGQRLGW